jgi:hypothetical protein
MQSEGSIPETTNEITSQWLTQMLHEHNVAPESVQVTGFTITDPGVSDSFAGQIARLHLTYNQGNPGLPTTMILKLHAPEPQLREFMKGFYTMEVRFYQELASAVSLRSPVCYLARASDDGSEMVMLLEDLAPVATIGTMQTQCTAEQAVSAARQLGRFHGEWWGNPALDEIAWLQTIDANPQGSTWQLLVHALDTFPARFGQHASTPVLAFVRSIVEQQPVVQGLYRARPYGLLHGDFRITNLAFTSGETHPPVYAFDWQLVRKGVPTRDLAWFLLSSLTIEQRESWITDMLSSYEAGLQDVGFDTRSGKQLEDDLRVGMLGAVTFGFTAISNVRIDADRMEFFMNAQKQIEAVIEEFRLWDLIGQAA